MDGIRLSKLARLVDAERVGDEDPVITGVASIGDAEAGDLTFVADRKHLDGLEASAASAVILPPDWPCGLPALLSEEPRAVFARVIEHFAPSRERVFPPGIHRSAVIDPEADVAGAASIGPHVFVGPGAVVGEGSVLGPQVVIEAEAVVGPGCTLHARVTVRERCRLGRNVVAHSGTVIGSDGFGFVEEAGRRIKIPQIGIVEIGDDVEIGANVCIDRAQTGRTVIGSGTKIDNLVQVGHNVILGEHCVLSAQTGISGSCRIGHRVIMGGQVGIADHRNIGEGALLAARSGIHRDVEPGQTVFGSPARDMRESRRIEACLTRLPEMMARVRRLASDEGENAENEEG